MFASLGVYKKMAQAGLFSLTTPREYGGAFSDTVTYALAIIALSKCDAGLSVAVNVTNMAAEAILRFGTPEQKKKYLTGISRYCPAAFALTEKGGRKRCESQFKPEAMH